MLIGTPAVLYSFIKSYFVIRSLCDTFYIFYVAVFCFVIYFVKKSEELRNCV